MKRNYIGLVHDEANQQYTKAQSPSSQPMKDYIRRLFAAVLERRGATG